MPDPKYPLRDLKIKGKSPNKGALDYERAGPPGVGTAAKRAKDKLVSAGKKLAPKFK